MTRERGQLPKAYLRIDPNIDRHPDMKLLLRLICEGARQYPRGHFRSWEHVVTALGRADAKRARDRHHLVEIDHGAWYIDGWDDWQEGDVTVGERMARWRQKKRESGVTPGAIRTTNWRLRNAVFARDHYTCRYCGVTDYQREWLVAEHVIPRPEGPTTLENLVTACRPCNKKKGPRTPEQAGMRLLPEPVGDASQEEPETRHDRNSPSEASGVRRQASGTELLACPPRARDEGPEAEAITDIASLQVQVWETAKNAATAVREPPDVVLRRCSRTPSGKWFDNPRNITSASWLRTTLAKLHAEILEAEDRNRPSEITREPTEGETKAAGAWAWIEGHGGHDAVVADYASWLDEHDAPCDPKAADVRRIHELDRDWIKARGASPDVLLIVAKPAGRLRRRAS